MKKTMICLGLIFIHWLVPIGVTAAERVDQQPGRPSADWSQKMQKLSKTLSELLTDISSDTRFQAPANKSRIEAHAKSISKLAHDLNKKGMKRPDLDPSIVMLSKLFSDEADHAYQELKRGHRDYARGRLRALTGYCIQCHTRTQSGPQFSNLPLNPATEKLSSFEKGEFFMATRQFDRAIQEFQGIMDDELAPLRRSVEWERSTRYALAVAVRVKQDPNLALKLVNSVVASKNAPYYMKQNALEWQKSIQEWLNESPRKAQTEEGYRTEAMRLLAAAHHIQKYPMDRSADIVYLRASAVVHEWMQMANTAQNRNEAYLMAGICYEVLKPLNLGEIHEMYYEACVRQDPHTPISEACFQRFQQSIFAGYTGSGGTHIPSDVEKKLSNLESLAHPVTLVPN